MPNPADTTCPKCGEAGSKVKPITPRSLLDANAKTRLTEDALYRFCKTEDCDVAYFSGSEEPPFVVSDLTTLPFQKSNDPNRLVCHCFEQSVAEVETDARARNSPSIAESITEKCRQGLDRCEEKNPQGRCCLGNVRNVAKGARGDDRAAVEDSAFPACCAPDAIEEPSVSANSEAAPTRNTGLWSAGGAVIASILSSACCWLPLALVSFGASNAGISGFFDAYRLPLLGVTAVLLGLGFYQIYVRKPVCTPGEACATPNRKVQRFNRIMLWVATAFTIAFALFPDYVGAVIGVEEEPPPLTSEDLSP